MLLYTRRPSYAEDEGMVILLTLIFHVSHLCSQYIRSEARIPYQSIIDNQILNSVYWVQENIKAVTEEEFKLSMFFDDVDIGLVSTIQEAADKHMVILLT